jgi:hypothetical protein
MSSDMRHAGTDTKRLFGDPVNNSVNTLSINIFFNRTRETMSISASSKRKLGK